MLPSPRFRVKLIFPERASCQLQPPLTTRLRDPSDHFSLNLSQKCQGLMQVRILLHILVDVIY